MADLKNTKMKHMHCSKIYNANAEILNSYSKPELKLRNGDI